MLKNNLRRGSAMPAVIAVVAAVVVLGGVVYFANQSKKADKMAEEKVVTDNNQAMEQNEDGMVGRNEDGVMKDDSMMEKDEGVMIDKEETMMKYSGDVLAGKSAPLLDFTNTDYDMALKTDKLIVLYFYANWCPICRAEFPEMQEAFNELTTDKVIGFRVNYNDDETDADEKDIAKQFGVAYQHTKVFVKNGQRVLKSPEGWDDNRYEMEIRSALDQ